MRDKFFRGVGQIDDVAAEAKARGYDSLLVRDVLDQYGEGDQLAIFDTSRIRSTKAKFDPANKDSADLLASWAAALGLGGLAAGALAPSDAKAKERR